MDNRFGMFIHWGLYALTEDHEQTFARRDMDRGEYEGLMRRFDPKNFDPEKWVLLAKKAGMRYICFTAKHHDGFCMWDTKYTDYNVMNTPFGKDVFRLLCDACAKHGMALSVYYSLPDWHHPSGYNSASTHQWKSADRAHEDTVAYRTYVKNQITELLTGYGKIYTLFWDIPPRIFDPSVNELVRKLQPDILINDRGYDPGDFSTPEREYEKCKNAPFAHRTEACDALGAQAWGYRAGEDFHTRRYLLSAIDGVMSRGGSYLLNVGPDANGEIAPAYEKRLLSIGRWYTRMEGCLEDHEPDPFAYNIFKCDYVANRKNGKTYIHFPGGLPADGIGFEHIPGMPETVRLMNTGKFLPFCIEELPARFSMETGKNTGPYLHVKEIPADDLPDEPIVLEITW